MNGRMHSQIKTGAICTTCPYRTDVEVSGVLYLGVVDDQQPSQLQDLTGQGLYQTDSLVRNHGALLVVQDSRLLLSLCPRVYLVCHITCRVWKPATS
jgi:hypothetical protein